MSATHGTLARVVGGPRSVAVLVLALGAFALTSQAMAPFHPDDAFISYRFAENLAAGDGLRFNPGEPPVESYSNLLWVLLASAFARGGLELPYWVPRLGVGFGMLAITCLWLVFRRSAVPPGRMVLPMLAFATFGPSVLYAVSGMESPLFGFLLIALVLCVDLVLEAGGLASHLLLAAVGVLLFLTRPEGILAFPTASFYLLILSRTGPASSRPSARRVALASLVFLASLLAFHAWRVQYFGEWLPTSFLSKFGGGSSLGDAWRINRTTYFTRQGATGVPFGHWYLAVILVAAVGLSMTERASRACRVAGSAFLLGLVFSFVYPSFVDWMPGMRYHASLVGLFLVPWGSLRLRRYGESEGRAGMLRAGALCAAVITLNLSGVAQLRIIASEMERNLRENSQALGVWLKEVIPPGHLIALDDVGALPYYSGLRTFDIHPESLTDLRIARRGFSTDYFFERDPDAVMFHSRGIFEARFRPEHTKLVEDPRFSAAYRFVGVTRFDWFRDHSYWLYARRGIPVSSDQLSRFPTGIGRIRRVAGKTGPRAPHRRRRPGATACGGRAIYLTGGQVVHVERRPAGSDRA